jgi:hypothetical protein
VKVCSGADGRMAAAAGVAGTHTIPAGAAPATHPVVAGARPAFGHDEG